MLTLETAFVLSANFLRNNYFWFIRLMWRIPLMDSKAVLNMPLLVSRSKVFTDMIESEMSKKNMKNRTSPKHPGIRKYKFIWNTFTNIAIIEKKLSNKNKAAYGAWKSRMLISFINLFIISEEVDFPKTASLHLIKDDTIKLCTL